MIKKKDTTRRNDLKQGLKILIRGFILAELTILIIKYLSNWGLEYRGYRSIGGEFFLVPLIVLLKVLFDNLKELYKGER